MSDIIITCPECGNEQAGDDDNDMFICMKKCTDCKRCDPYIERNAIEYDTAYGWCEAKKKDVGVIVWECLFWAPKVLLITLALLLPGCVHVKLPDGTEYWRVGEQQIGEVLLEKPDGTTFLMDGQKSELPKVEITKTSIIIGRTEVKP